MVDNKDAESLKETENIKLKIYYSGDTPAISGVKEVSISIPEQAKVWLVKEVIFSENNTSRKTDWIRQFVECATAYDTISKEMERIVSASIVNEKQKKAILELISKCLDGALLEDKAHEGDFLSSIMPVLAS